ncbi:MAG TPA: toluene tolerance protein [Parvularcula sp.]|nr:toluene tolerance protein [Parvularcula sp.]
MKTLLRAALVSASAAAIIAPARADQAAEAFVTGVLTEANAIFENSDAASRDASVETLVDKYVDMERVARFALGQYARQATPEQMAVYTPLFRRYATSVYQSTLENYSGQKLQVTDSIDRTERDFIVNSKVVGAKPGDQYADLVVSWRVYRKPDGAQAIVDAGAEGVWLAIEQQSQFKSVIANNGGGAKGIDALIADLKTKVGG